MRTYRLPLAACLVAALLLGGCSERLVSPDPVASTTAELAQAHAGRTFAAPLDGGQEVPAVATQGTGVATFKLSKDGDALSYHLTVANIDDVTQSHIHLADRGSNGPVVAFLFGFVPGGVTTQGVLAEGTITSGDLLGPLAGQPLSALIDAMRSGGTYVNVHTVEKPAGEIRGQIDRGSGPAGS